MMRTFAWWLHREPVGVVVVRLAAFFYDQIQAQGAFLGPLGAVVAQIEALIEAGYVLDDRPAPTRDMLCPDCQGWAGLPVPASQRKDSGHNRRSP